MYHLIKACPEARAELKDEWHWGATGTGKTRGVRTRYPDAYLKSNTKWWDGYNCEAVVILDEMTPNTIGSWHIKLWTDYGAFMAETKGGSVRIRPELVIITSNYSIRECYPEPKDYEAIERRFKVHHYPAV